MRRYHGGNMPEMRRKLRRRDKAAGVTMPYNQPLLMPQSCRKPMKNCP